ncbi:MAG: cytochrome d ubiquinol oxidase subunit II, partial [Solirubrobacterales bacterium]
MDAYTFLQALWFVLISVLWLGYFVLEGFDFGVGMLIRAVGKSKAERRAVIHSIGPVWDGNEVWLLVAGGATFAAFPQWYATLFSGFYLALFLILVGLIVRNVSFEFWGKATSERGRERWEWALMFGSFLPALLWGVGWANIVHGVPIDASHEYTGTLFTLLNPYALLGGLTTLAIFLAHGAIFLNLRTTGAVAERARGIGATVAPIAAALGIGFLVWTVASHPGGIDLGSAIVAAVSALALVAAAALADVSPGRAFAATTVGILTFCLALFVDLFPHA